MFKGHHPVTFHLTTKEAWEQQRTLPFYQPEAFAREGFIHCTDGEHNMVDTANRYYTAAPDIFICLEIDTAKVTAEIKYEDPAHIYPHIYGPLNTDAVVAVRTVARDANRAFLSLGPAVAP